MIRTAGGLDEPEAGCIYDLGPTQNVVLVAFGGLVAWDLVGYGEDPSAAGSEGRVPFEFFNLVAGEPVGKVFVRDLDQAFYQRGVRGLGTSVDQVASGLRGLIGERSRIVFVGQSAGGFGAMLFGALMGVDEVLAFSPQTFLSPWWRRRHHDDRWPAEVARARHGAGWRLRNLDVRPGLRAAKGRVTVNLYYGDQNRLDEVHCRHLERLPGVQLHPVATGSHAVARRMRENATLREVVNRSLRTDG